MPRRPPPLDRDRLDRITRDLPPRVNAAPGRDLRTTAGPLPPATDPSWPGPARAWPGAGTSDGPGVDPSPSDGWVLDLGDLGEGPRRVPANVRRHTGAGETAREHTLDDPHLAGTRREEAAIVGAVPSARSRSESGRHRPPAPPVASVPLRLADATWRPRWTAIAAALVVLVAVAMVLGVRVAMARSQAEPQPVTASSGHEGVTRHGGASGSTRGQGTEGSDGAASGAGTATPSPGPTSTGVVVDVSGQVRRPGVVRLAPGARVVDALAAAGGTVPGADVASLNEARPLVDGEMLYVARPGEQAPAVSAPSAAAAPGTTATAPAAGTTGTATGATPPGGVVDLNSATAEQLDALPGVGPAIAKRIIDWRTQHGRFSTVDELSEVQGIGPKVLERLRPGVRV